tara:strand:+ start:1139 stop:2065 length:927 start_codon:yes stop_codon:yes gene_type:complete
MKQTKNIYSLVLCFVLSTFLCSCVTKKEPHTHDEALQKADSLFKIGHLTKAIDNYKNIWEGGKERDISYQLSMAYSLMEQKDSAYYYLSSGLEGDTGVYRLFSGELYALLDDSLYLHLADKQLEKYKAKFGQFKKPHLAKKLFLMSVKDQAYYYHLEAYPDSLGHYWKIKEQLNKENLEALEEIIKQHGWPKKSEVGFEAAGTAFLVVQHTKKLSVLKKYLPYLRNAVDENEADKSQLALLIDRINVRDGKKQVYGSQVSYDSIQKVYFIDTVSDPENLNKRRAEMGLEPIEDYIKRWGNAESRIYDE